MSYNKQNFVNGQPLTAQQLNHIENGIVQLDAELDNVKTEIPKYIQTGALPDSTIGFNATVEGASNIASGDYSHAEGSYTAASEENSHAEGRNSRASGQSSHAEGSSTQATASSAHAEGSLTQATGAYAHAEGYRTVASEYASHAEGVWTTASGYAPHAEGNMTTASGYASHAEGDKTTASGYASHAEGGYLYSDEEGYLEEFIIDDLNTSIISTTAEGIQSHAEGTQTLAYGYSSHSEGYRTVASGDYSHAEGSNTIASSSGQHVQGRYNIEDTDNTYAHIVGNGSSTTRSNAYTLDWDGNAWFAGAINCKDKTTTLANLGAAPAGYGLGGEAERKDWSEVDSITANGTYRFNGIHQTINGIYVVSAVMQVINFGDSYCTQILRTVENASGHYKSYTLVRSKGAIGWDGWECPDPPMQGETEYRTTERFYGKPVYCKSFTCGAMPSSGEKSRNHGTMMDDVVRVSARCYFANGECVSLPIMDAVSVHIIGSSSIYLWCKNGGDQFVNTEVDVYYTKP